MFSKAFCTSFSLSVSNAEVASSKIAARPSGTEPKIKFYISVNKELQSIQDYTTEDKKLSAKIARIKEELKLG